MPIAVATRSALDAVAATGKIERRGTRLRSRRKLAFAGVGESSSGRSAAEAEAEEMLAEGFRRD